MATPFEYEKNRHTGLRAAGEDDRSDEFKEARNKLVEDVNSWLTKLAEKRDNGEPLSNGVKIITAPRIVKTDLGPSGRNTHMIGIDKYFGVSLTGNGREQPLSLQSVVGDAETDHIEVTEVTGSDPVAMQVHGHDYNLRRSQEVVASFGVADYSPTERERYFNFTVNGDGSVTRNFLSEQGVHTGQSISKLEDLNLAQMAFAQITQNIS